MEDEENSEKNSNKEEINKDPNLMGKLWGGFKDVWKQTFPNEDMIVDIFEKRKKEAIKFKSELVELTDEMIDEVLINL